MRRIALLLSCILLIAFPASAQEGKKLSSGAVQAAKEFNAYLAKTAAAKAKPNLAAPPAAPLFATIFNTKALPSLPPPTAADLSWQSEWLGASANSYMAMLNFGTSPNAPDYQTVLAENVERDENEISSAMEFMLRLMPRVVVSAKAFMAGLSEAERNQPVRQQGAARVRDGYMQTVSGAIAFIGGGPKAENVKLIAKALRDTVDEWRAAATPEERTQLLNTLGQIRQNIKDSEATDHLAAISSALAATK